MAYTGASQLLSVSSKQGIPAQKNAYPGKSLPDSLATQSLFSASKAACRDSQSGKRPNRSLSPVRAGIGCPGPREPQQ